MTLGVFYILCSKASLQEGRVAIVHYVTLQLSVRDVTGVCAHMCTLENVNCWFYNEVIINMF